MSNFFNFTDYDTFVCFYYGCWKRPGHFLYRPNGASVWINDTFPWEQLDGALCAEDPVKFIKTGFTDERQIEGEAKIHHKDGWTALSFWDRSGDHRGNSNSNFIVKGKYTFAQMIEISKYHFPEIWKRIKFEVSI